MKCFARALRQPSSLLRHLPYHWPSHRRRCSNRGFGFLNLFWRPARRRRPVHECGDQGGDHDYRTQNPRDLFRIPSRYSPVISKRVRSQFLIRDVNTGAPRKEQARTAIPSQKWRRFEPCISTRRFKCRVQATTNTAASPGNETRRGSSSGPGNPSNCRALFRNEAGRPGIDRNGGRINHG